MMADVNGHGGVLYLYWYLVSVRLASASVEVIQAQCSSRFVFQGSDVAFHANKSRLGD